MPNCSSVAELSVVSSATGFEVHQVWLGSAETLKSLLLLLALSLSQQTVKSLTSGAVLIVMNN